jgi:signal transduction histidine kinase
VSLRLRLTLTYALLVALILGAFSFVLYVAMRQALEAEMDRRLQVRANQVELSIWPGTTDLAAEDVTFAKLNLSPLDRLNAPTLYVQVRDNDGDVIVTSSNLRGGSLPTDEPSLAMALSGQRVLGDVTIDEHHGLRILSVPISAEGKVVGVLQVAQSRRILQETIDELRTRLQLLGIGALLVAGLVGWLVAHRGLRDLSRMSHQAAEIATRRDFSRRLGIGQRRDEIGQLARTVDDLLVTVEDTLRTHREFVADTSHELRNPLLAIQTNLDLVNRVPNREARAECVQEARQQVEHMSRLVADLLLLAQVEAGQVVERRRVPLFPVLERVAEEARHQSNGREISLEGNRAVEILGDEGRLRQVFSNLVDNAVKHTLPDGHVRVMLDRYDGRARVSVVDDGEGIPAEHLTHVFDRFYQVRPPQADSATSPGLGLAIVKHLTEAHGGTITVDSEVGRGSRFTVWLPLYCET